MSSCLLPCSINLAKCLANEAIPLAAFSAGFFGVGGAALETTSIVSDKLNIHKISETAGDIIGFGVAYGFPICTEALLLQLDLPNCAFGAATVGYYVSSLLPYIPKDENVLIMGAITCVSGILIADVVNSTVLNISSPLLQTVVTNATCLATGWGVNFLTKKIALLTSSSVSISIRPARVVFRSSNKSL